MPRITSDGPSNAAAQPGEPGYVTQDAEVSLVAISGEPGPELADFTGDETVVPVEGLADQPAEAAPAPRRAGGRRAAGGGAS